MSTLESKLHWVMDAECEKKLSEIDTALIAECADTLLRMEPTPRYRLSAEEYEAALKRILTHRPVTRKKLSRTAKIILIAAILLLLSLLPVLSSQRIRYYIQSFDTHSIVSAFLPDTKLSPITVQYIPRGFYLEGKEMNAKIVSEKYTVGVSFLNITKTTVTENIHINTEYGETEEIVFDGVSYLLFGIDENGGGVIWFANNCCYIVDGGLSREELIKVAQSVD